MIKKEGVIKKTRGTSVQRTLRTCTTTRRFASDCGHTESARRRDSGGSSSDSHFTTHEVGREGACTKQVLSTLLDHATAPNNPTKPTSAPSRAGSLRMCHPEHGITQWVLAGHLRYNVTPVPERRGSEEALTSPEYTMCNSHKEICTAATAIAKGIFANTRAGHCRERRRTQHEWLCHECSRREGRTWHNAAWSSAEEHKTR